MTATLVVVLHCSAGPSWQQGVGGGEHPLCLPLQRLEKQCLQATSACLWLACLRLRPSATSCFACTRHCLPPQIVQHVTGFNHYLAPPLFGFSLSMSVLMCEWVEGADSPPGWAAGVINPSSCRDHFSWIQAVPHAPQHPPTADLRDGPGGTKLIGKQVDYHSFESIL